MRPTESCRDCETRFGDGLAEALPGILKEYSSNKPKARLALEGPMVSETLRR